MYNAWHSILLVLCLVHVALQILIHGLSSQILLPSSRLIMVSAIMTVMSIGETSFEMVDLFRLFSNVKCEVWNSPNRRYFFEFCSPVVK